MRSGTAGRRGLATVLSLVALAATGCSAGTAQHPRALPRASASRPPIPTPSMSARPEAGSPIPKPPRWLGTRALPVTGNGFGEVRPTPRGLRRRAFTLPDELAALPGHAFAVRVTSPAPREVLRRSTWHRGCPVAASALSWVRLTFWGFDSRRHTGELLIATAVTRPVASVFRRLYRARFPIEQMTITTRAELAATPTGDGNNTGAFVCRRSTGSATFSEHAYGRAVDINPFQNPYHHGGVVLPELATSYLDRDRRRPGMVSPEGIVVAAFARIGWRWGGSWHESVDYQHFSASGR